ncbi:hypothetical protein, partial [Bacillus pumilus]|uniref:hypothetical protein n=1 Tax=Bacillus pumilus TaxID=1408 RepID=UPI001C99BC8A
RSRHTRCIRWSRGLGDVYKRQRLISLYMLTAFCLGFIVNYAPGSMLPIYILAMIGLILCLVHIALHLSLIHI